MKVRDKELRKDVDVSCRDCPKYKCYWPRPHPGVFTQGSGYSQVVESGKKYGWICGTREVHSCPDNPVIKDS